MFKNLTSFSYKRNWKEAIGFYLAYFLLGLMLSGISGVIFGTLSEATTFREGFNSGRHAGAVVSIVFCLVIAVSLLVQKKMHQNFGYVILALLSAMLAAFGGALLGLIIPAFMTTRGASDTEAFLK
jgi:uncharacterized membrane protein